MRFLFPFFQACFLLALSLAAQPLRIERLSVEEGLSHGAVSSIMQDQSGYLWLGTQQGLNRYDGYGFTVYNRNYTDTTSLSSSAIRSLYQDRQGRYWIGTDGSGLNLLNPHTGVCIRYGHRAADSTSLSHDDVYFVKEDRKGRLWVGTYGGGLNLFDPATGRFTRYAHQPDDASSIPDDYLRTVYVDEAGIFWIGTAYGGLCRFDPERRQFTRYAHLPTDPASLGKAPIWAICAGDRDHLWIATDGDGLFLFNKQTGKCRRYVHQPGNPTSLSHNHVSALLRDRSGALWVGTWGGGLNRLADPGQGQFVRYTHHPAQVHSLSSNTILSLHQDRSGLIWAGTNGHGLNKVNPARPNFERYAHDPSQPEGLSDNAIRAVWEDESGAVWVGTNGSGLDLFDPVAGTASHFRPDSTRATSLQGLIVLALCGSRTGDLWVGSYDGGLNRLDRRKQTFSHYRHDPKDSTSLVDDRVMTVYEDRSGVLWVGTYEDGLDRLDPGGGQFTHYRAKAGQPGSLSSNAIRCLYEDRAGNLWVGTFGGLNLLDRRRGTFRHFRHDPKDPYSLSSNKVRCLYEDAAGGLWVGTGEGGLNYLDRKTGRFTRYTRRQGLPDEVVLGVLGDRAGDIWCSTNRGLARLDGRRVFRNYEESDGLQGNEFSVGAYHAGRSGKLYFGGFKGLTAFYPDSVRDNPFVPPVVFTDLVVAGKSRKDLLQGAAIALDHRENSLSFDFAALSFEKPLRNRYAYRLEGFEPDWVHLEGRHYASYTNLPPGRYTFRVKAANSDGVWNQAGARLTVHIASPYWQRNWFRALLLLGLAALGWVGYKARIRRIQVRNQLLEKLIKKRTEELRRQSQQLADSLREAEQQRQRAEEANRIKTELTNITVHDLKNPLGGIALYADLIGQAAGNPEKVVRLSATVKDTSQRMSHLVSNLLKRAKLESSFISLQKERIDVSLLLRGAVERNRAQALRKGQQLHLEEASPCYAEVDVDLISDVVENLISNAIKFTPGEKSIWLGVTGGENTVTIRVRDEGLGIRSEEMDKLFGPFQRLSATPTGGESSTGLGLAIVKRIVELHGGQVTAESAGADQGTVFTVTLPASANG